MIHQVRVIFGDTDQMGVVYYANYLRYFEGARAAFLRAMGKSYADLMEWGIALPVVEAHCRYRLPALYEDLLEVDVRVDRLRKASMRFAYEIRRDADLIAEGFTRHACISQHGRPTRVPAELERLIQAGSKG